MGIAIENLLERNELILDGVKINKSNQLLVSALQESLLALQMLADECGRLDSRMDSVLNNLPRNRCGSYD